MSFINKDYLQRQFSNFSTKISNVFAKKTELPTKLSQLTNDGNYVSDSNYNHTDNNYTTEEKNKLRLIESGAQLNIIETIKVNNEEQSIQDKTVNIAVPTQPSDIGAMANTVTHLSGDVPIIRTVNGKNLSEDITLTYTDVQALPNTTFIPTVTDEYSATSHDGMSGVAVASAIQNKADKATTLSGYGITDGATSAQGEKADTAVQSVLLNGLEYKVGTTVTLPSYPTTLPASDVYDWAKEQTKPSYTSDEVGALSITLKGVANGLAELDASGKVPSSQLPSFVDDVLEYDTKSDFPSTGESGKIYVDKSTDKTYRWSGSAYVIIKGDLALGETSSTAYRGDRGKIAYEHSQSEHARVDATNTVGSDINGNILVNGVETKVYTHPSGTNPHGTTKSDVGLGNVGNFKAVSTERNQGLTDEEKANARANIGASDFSGEFSDLKNVPTIPTEQTVIDWGFTKFDGNYNSLTNKPTIPSKVSDLTNDSNFVSDENYIHTDNNYATADKNAVATISNKVDKVDGKGLSTNDYTTEEKNKLDGVESGAQVNKIETIKVNGTTQQITNKEVNITVALTKEDIGLGNVGNFKAVSTEANQSLTTTEQENARTNIGAGTSNFSGDYNDLSNQPSIPSKLTDLTNDGNFVVDANYVHTDNNYSTVDKTEVGKISNKVDKVQGKDLSTNDYTTDEKNKLMNISSGAQVNVIETIKVNGVTQEITNKAVNINVAVTKSDVGLGNVDNTSDANKPISTATQTALDNKINTADLSTTAMTFENDTYVYVDSNMGKYIATNGTTINTSSVVSTAGWGYRIVDCEEGEEFYVSGKGGSTPRLWAFYNDSNNIVSKSEENATATDIKLTTPSNATHLIVQSSVGGAYIKTLGTKNVTISDMYANAEHRIYSITEDIVTVTKNDTKGVSPYSTSYKYTDITINPNSGVKWVEGGLYIFVVNTTMVVSSDYRNVRVRIGENDTWHPVMGSSAILSGNSYFTKAYNTTFQYKTTYRPEGALHLQTDNNTTYGYLVNTVPTGTMKIDAKGYGARYSIAFPTTPIGTVDERWSSIVKSSATGTTKVAVALDDNKLYVDRGYQYILTANIVAGASSTAVTYQRYTGRDIRYVANTSSTYCSTSKPLYLYMKDYNHADKSFAPSAEIGNLVTLDKLSTRFPITTEGYVYLYFMGWTSTTWYTLNDNFSIDDVIYRYTPSTGELVSMHTVELAQKQDKLVAGENISINGNTISAINDNTITDETTGKVYSLGVNNGTLFLREVVE